MIRKILLNTVLSLGILEIVFAVLDWFNPYMNFQSNTFGKAVTLAFAAAGIALAVCEMARTGRRGNVA